MQVISSSGVRFQPRFVVLTEEYLAFSRAYDKNLAKGALSAETSEAQIENFRGVFHEFDKDNDG